MENLKEIHEKIKNHPYRTENNNRHIKSYKDLLYELNKKFYYAVVETKYQSAKNLVHDFSNAISYFDDSKHPFHIDLFLHLEECLSIIHKFIDTGKVLEFPTFYTGVNFSLPSLGRRRVYKFNDEIEKFQLVIPSNLKKKVKKDAIKKIKEIKSSIKANYNYERIVELSKEEIEYYEKIITSCEEK